MESLTIKSLRVAIAVYDSLPPDSEAAAKAADALWLPLTDAYEEVSPAEREIVEAEFQRIFDSPIEDCF